MLGDEGMDMIAQAIANGVPLSKRHGRIGDIDELNDIFEEACKDFAIDNMNFKSVMDMNFYLAQVIVEAENEEE